MVPAPTACFRLHGVHPLASKSFLLATLPYLATSSATERFFTASESVMHPSVPTQLQPRQPRRRDCGWLSSGGRCGGKYVDYMHQTRTRIQRILSLECSYAPSPRPVQSRGDYALGTASVPRIWDRRGRGKQANAVSGKPDGAGGEKQARAYMAHQTARAGKSDTRVRHSKDGQC